MDRAESDPAERLEAPAEEAEIDRDNYEQEIANPYKRAVVEKSKDPIKQSFGPGGKEEEELESYGSNEPELPDQPRASELSPETAFKRKRHLE